MWVFDDALGVLRHTFCIEKKIADIEKNSAFKEVGNHSSMKLMNSNTRGFTCLQRFSWHFFYNWFRIL